MRWKGFVPAITSAVFVCVALSGLRANAEPSTASSIAEARRTFTIDGHIIPPEIFRDFGDGDLADSETIWVTLDVKAAVGSNRYFDEIKQTGRWVSQKKISAAGGASEETRYCYHGATRSGLVVVLASYSAGGTGVFFSLHILDLVPNRAFDSEGKIQERINLTHVRSIALGDRWNGEIHVEENTVRVITTRAGPADNSGKRVTRIYEAKRP